MSGQAVALAFSVFLACAVEAVEALTIVLAVGTTRSWRSALTGSAAAVLALAVTTAILGPRLTSLPLDTLRLVVGGLLLVFGLQWLRKAILRGAGLMAAARRGRRSSREEAAARGRPRAPREGLDGYSFTIAFKGVLLEGLEVVFIALTFGANQHRVGLAAAAAAAPFCWSPRSASRSMRPLARAPENAMKFGVGVMLTSFGIFWGAEGAGAHWPGGDAALLVVVPTVLAFSLALVQLFRVSPADGQPARA